MNPREDPMRQRRLRQIRELIESELAIILTERYSQPVERGVPLRYYLDFKTDARLIELRDALDRMERGCFGSCVLCGIQIPARILEASPTRQLCSGCDASSVLKRHGDDPVRRVVKRPREQALRVEVDAR
jgi:RNA polymerase-binding transcription factor DksA